MGRIRSQHPGQWSDEDFVQMSFAARLLALAVRNEADDQGVFEWKPTTLKMRLFPADGVDIETLLGELVTHKQVRRFQFEGKEYAAIRNFRKYQRPKKPNSVYPMPPEFRTYVGLSEASSPPDEDKDRPVPPKGEIAPQMKEEGGRREDVGDKKQEAGAFLGKVIRLSAGDLATWKKSFRHIPNFEGVLQTRDDWLAHDAPPDTKRRWFMSTSNYLGKLDAEHAAKPPKPGAGKPYMPPAVGTPEWKAQNEKWGI